MQALPNHKSYVSELVCARSSIKRLVVYAASEFAGRAFWGGGVEEVCKLETESEQRPESGRGLGLVELGLAEGL